MLLSELVLPIPNLIEVLLSSLCVTVSLINSIRPMNKQIMRLRYEQPKVEAFELDKPLDILDMFSYIELEIEEWEEGEDLDVI